VWIGRRVARGRMQQHSIVETNGSARRVQQHLIEV
jgi:hypothetical protein